MKTLLKPAGPYLVGSCSHEVCDSSRPSHLLSQDSGRELFIKLWYPTDAAASGGSEREKLWEQLQGEPNIPGLVRLLLRPAMKVSTNSVREGPYAAHAGPPRVLIYSHGMISFASENTSLMEHLASYGYTVVSLQHKEQIKELRALQGAQSANEKQEQKKLERSIKASDATQRPELWSRYYRMASNTNRIVSARADDIGLVVRTLGSLLAAVPDLDGSATAEAIGVIGLSLGGAVSTEYVRRGGSGVSCVVNMDGGIYGTLLDEPVRGRYLMLYSEPNGDINKASLPVSDTADVRVEVVRGTKHLNFHDIAMIYPLLKWLGITGSAQPSTVIRRRNELITEFISNVRSPASGPQMHQPSLDISLQRTGLCVEHFPKKKSKMLATKPRR